MTDLRELTYKYTSLLLYTEVTPSVYVSLYSELSEESYSSDVPFVFTVQEGQEFGVLCETESHFTVDWFTSSGSTGQ